jgi:hypothetical protein
MRVRGNVAHDNPQKQTAGMSSIGDITKEETKAKPDHHYHDRVIG